MLEDLIVAAHADAKRKVEAIMAEEMQKATGGLDLPGGHETAVLKSALARVLLLRRRGGYSATGSRPRPCRTRAAGGSC